MTFYGLGSENRAIKEARDAVYELTDENKLNPDELILCFIRYLLIPQYIYNTNSKLPSNAEQFAYFILKEHYLKHKYDRATIASIVDKNSDCFEHFTRKKCYRRYPLFVPWQTRKNTEYTQKNPHAKKKPTKAPLLKGPPPFLLTRQE